MLHFIEAVVTELDDPISPEFARTFVVDTSSENIAPGLVDVLVEDILAVPTRVWKQTFAGLLEYDDQTDLPLIEAPTLLVWGDADALVSRAMQDLLAGAIPDAELLVYPNVGHTPRWDDPVRFSNDLTTFARGRWAVADHGGRNWGAYTVDEVALRHGAGVEAETSDPQVAYARFPKPSGRGIATAGFRRARRHRHDRAYSGVAGQGKSRTPGLGHSLLCAN